MIPSASFTRTTATATVEALRLYFKPLMLLRRFVRELRQRRSRSSQLDRLKKELRLDYIEVDDSLPSSVLDTATTLLYSLKDTPSAASLIGRFLCVKTTRSSGATIVVLRMLINDEYAIVDSDPALLNNPEHLLRLLRDRLLPSPATDENQTQRVDGRKVTNA